MKLHVCESGFMNRIGKMTGSTLWCPWDSNQVRCGDWCPFCEVDDKQVVLHCTGRRLVYERITQ